MTRRILIFTGTRAEYGLLRNVLRHLVKQDGIDAHLLVSGSHLSSVFGGTRDEIEKDGLAPVYAVDIGLGEDSPVSVCRSMGLAMERYGEALTRLRPDLLMVLGDRYEALCAVAAAAVLRVPVAHLYGGESTQGAVDEYFRHAMTKMSHLHFTSCEIYRRRIIRMGEEPDKVWNVGSLGVENARSLPELSEREVRTYLGVPADIPYVVATYHPATQEGEAPEAQLTQVLEALGAWPDLHVVFTGANADAGGARLNTLLSNWAEGNPCGHFFLSLGVERYLNAARYAVGVVGNSSSGVLEIPSLGVPVLDIGSRQEGRERSRAVLHCQPEREDMEKALERLFSPDAREAARREPNPYEQTGTARNIANIVSEFNVSDILKKKFFDATD